MTAHFNHPAIPEALRDVVKKSRVSLSLADYRAPDCPLVGVNERFCSLSGYSHTEVLGRNCRFLQPRGGAGPVRERMRDFLTDRTQTEGRFLIPNVRRNGKPFLNLVYMSKLSQAGQVMLVLGSQFSVGVDSKRESKLYDAALIEDLRVMRDVLDDNAMLLLGSYESLASSHSIIAQARLEGFDE